MKHKEALFRLAKAERGRKSAEAAVAGAEKQAKEQRGQLRMPRNSWLSFRRRSRYQKKKKKELEGKEVEITKAE